MSSDVPPMTDEMPPGPDGLPIVGNYLASVRRPFEFMTDNAAEYGDVVGWKELDGPVYQLNHPDDIEHVLVQNNQNYVKGDAFQRTLGPITGNGILNSEGAVWRRNRHLIQPAFHPDRIQEYAEMMTDATEEMLATWEDGQTRPVHEDMMTVTLKIVARALFGVDINDHVDDIGSALEEFMAASESLSNYVLPQAVPTPSRRRIREARARLDEVVYELIEERRANPGERDVISMLIDVTDDEGERLSTEQIRDEVVTLLLAGHETTALSLTFTAYALARHPGAEAKLIAELDEVLDGRTPEMTDLPELTYTEQVVKESMRLYPPVPGIVREPVKPDVVGGYEIPPGATVRMHQWVVHRDARWYDDPLAFEPERWTDDFEQSLPRLAYFPFAAGPRRCIGDRFAMLEARLLLATIYQRYHLELTPGATLDLMATVTARPKEEIPMTVRRR
ncbi:cytochrome P450 [Halogeometricum pallidum JCM 14848]|uniref:Cytochrome P450 n=1 Tax=Halogeometricum pallidum JCM 14848 TaxID=1227487 RepID=M0CZM6_HALPD|nr:cytochrome P450 [Halogeometricum pallidum]ELZ28063.1 cytochrome P450 [Halogeometricum pallidum JCM 14848]